MVSTLFIAGFPDDASQREVRNFFRLCDGLDGVVINSERDGRIKQVFVKFLDPGYAKRALKKLEGIVFDEVEDAYPLKSEWAKRDAEVRDEHRRDEHRKDDEYARDDYESRKRPRSSAPSQAPPEPPPPPSRGIKREYKTTGQIEELRRAPGRPSSSRDTQHADNSDAPWRKPREESGAKQRKQEDRSERRSGGSGEISTLAIKTEGHTEDELRDTFERYPGYIDGACIFKAKTFFARFEIPEQAQRALDFAHEDGFVGGIAKRDFDPE